MGKKLVTNQEYQKILRKEADYYWKKVFAAWKSNPKMTRDELDSLKTVYWKEFNDSVDQYEIVPFVATNSFPEINRLVNTLCNAEEQKTIDCKLFRGSIHRIGMTADSDALYTLLKGIGAFSSVAYKSHYNQVLKSDLHKVTVGYCEGDIFITIHDTEEDYQRELKDIANYYGEL